MARVSTFFQKIKTLIKQSGVVGIVIASLLALLMIGALLQAMVDSSKPGDIGFPLDRTFEKIRIATSFSDTSRFKYKIEIATERLDELSQIDQTDTETALLALDELEHALRDVLSEIDTVSELSDVEADAKAVCENLLDLVARYRAFILGETNTTVDIQKELDEGSQDIQTIQSSQAVPQQNTTNTPQPNTSQTKPVANDEDDDDDECESNYQQTGGQVEYEGVVLSKNTCGEYTITTSGKTYVLVTTSSLDYAVGQRVKLHGNAGTNNSIFVTEFEVDN